MRPPRPACSSSSAACSHSFDLTGDDTIDAIRSLRAAMHGFVSLELLGGFAIPLDIDRSYERLITAVIDSFSNPGDTHANS